MRSSWDLTPQKKVSNENSEEINTWLWTKLTVVQFTRVLGHPFHLSFDEDVNERFAMADVRSEASSARSGPRRLRYGWCPLRSFFRSLRPSSSSCDLPRSLASYSCFSPLFWSIRSFRQLAELMLWVKYPLSDLFFLVSLWCSFCVIAHIIFGAFLHFHTHQLLCFSLCVLQLPWLAG